MKKAIFFAISLALAAATVLPSAPLAKAYGGVLSLSQTSVSINSGSSMQVYAYPNNSQSIYLAAVINTNVMNATLSGNTINISAYTSGNGQVQVCTYDGDCGLINVYVNGYNSGYNYNNNYPYSNTSPLTLSQTNITMYPGQTQTIYISGGSQPYYLGNTNNSTVATASISGSTLTMTAFSSGSVNVSVCSSGYGSCATLYVYIPTGYDYNYNNNYNNNYNYNNYLSLSSNVIPDAVSGQYYSYQLNASGGVSPYRFYLYSGSLPSGLSLGTNGLISGYPTNSSTSFSSNFYLTIYDNYGRSSQTTQLTLRVNPSGYNYGNNYNNNQNWNWYNNNNGSVLGAYTYNNGTLINDGGTVYITYKNQKSGFANADAFLGLGYKWENVINASASNLSASGYTITSNSVAHPWGSWVKSGQTVFFVDPSGLIPVPSYDIFINNGGNLTSVVDMNYYDGVKQRLPAMVLNDSRLR